jgi:O-antigen ligase
MDAIFYGIVVIAGAFYLFRRSGEGIWVVFVLLAITALLYPVSLNDIQVPEGGAFRPYNFVIASMAAALVMGTRRRRHEVSNVTGKTKASPVKWMIALAGVFSLATLYGDLSPSKAGAVYVLQQSSAWVSFFLFVWIGYRLSLSGPEVQSSFAKLRVAATVYCFVFLGKFAYLTAASGLTDATDFAYSQRLVLYFATVVFVLLIARRLAPEGKAFAKTDWLSAIILLPAVVLSGSRGLIGAAILTVLVLVAVWRVRSLLRLIPLLIALVAVGALVLRSNSPIVEDYLVGKFLIAPEDDLSYMGRVSEMQAVVEAVRNSPVLGRGTLAPYMFLDSMFGWRETAFVDNGAGYLLMKTGLLGTSIFVLLVLSYLKVLRHLRRSIAADALIPLVVVIFYLAFLPFGPSFFDPRYAWLVGIQCGYSLYLNKVHSGKTRLWAMEIAADGNRGSRSYA